MGQQIIKQPDGRLAVFSSVTDTFILLDATAEEVVEWRASEAAERARELTRAEVERVLSDAGPQTVYRQATLTWDEAVRRHHEHNGDLEVAEQMRRHYM